MRQMQQLPERQKGAMEYFRGQLPLDYKLVGVCYFEDKRGLGAMTVLNSQDEFLTDGIYEARAETLRAHRVPFAVYVVYANTLAPVKRIPLPGLHVLLER